MGNSSNDYVRVPWRMERIPDNGYTVFLAFVLGLAFFFEWVDNGSISYFLPVFSQEFALESAALGLIGTCSNIGVMVGNLLSGIISDKIGRKRTIIIGMIMWGIAGVLQSLTPGLSYLIAVRIFLGLGLGIQLAATITLVSESIPSRKRARYVVTTLALAPLGSACAGILCYFLIPAIGWRGVSLIEALPALCAILIGKAVPESAFWLEAKGRLAEADAAMTRIEEGVRKKVGELPPVVIPEMEPALKKKASSASFADLFRGRNLRPTIMNSIWWPATMIGSYGLTTWFSMIFVQKGIAITSSILYTSIMTLGGVLGVFVLPKLLDVVGRKASCCIIAGIAAVAAICYGSVNVIPLLIAFGCMFNFGAQGVAQVSVTYASESYPTNIRNTGVGYCQFIGRLGSVLGPIILGAVMGALGVKSAVYFAALVYIIGALAVVILGEETKGKVFTEE